MVNSLLRFSLKATVNIAIVVVHFRIFCKYLTTLLMASCSLAHPYLLADNRHYPFYLWRKVIKAQWLMKYLLVPLYVYSWFSIFSKLGQYKLCSSRHVYALTPPRPYFKHLSFAGKTRTKIWVLAYSLATAAVLVPAPLIEFRYYTIPFYFMILNSNIHNNQSWLLMGVIYIALNIFTMGMFLFRPFHWDHESGIQRFIWWLEKMPQAGVL